MPKGKTPSLIGSSLGRPKVATAGKKSACSRCDTNIAKGEKCFDVPQPSKPFSSTRRFCAGCFTKVLAQTRLDLVQVEAL
jgi:hypothetical protein